MLFDSWSTLVFFHAINGLIFSWWSNICSPRWIISTWWTVTLLLIKRCSSLDYLASISWQRGCNFPSKSYSRFTCYGLANCWDISWAHATNCRIWTRTCSAFDIGIWACSSNLIRTCAANSRCRGLNSSSSLRCRTCDVLTELRIWTICKSCRLF